MEKEKRDIPLKNYIIALLIVLGTVFLAFYIKKSYEISRVRNSSQSVLSRVIGEIKYDEIDNVFLEINGSYYIYISHLSNDEIVILEEDLKELIATHDLQNNFYYLNVNDKNNNANLIKNLNNKFKLEAKKINYLPTVLYYEDGEFKDLITSSKNKTITIEEIKTLVGEIE